MSFVNKLETEPEVIHLTGRWTVPQLNRLVVERLDVIKDLYYSLNPILDKGKKPLRHLASETLGYYHCETLDLGYGDQNVFLPKGETAIHNTRHGRVCTVKDIECYDDKTTLDAVTTVKLDLSDKSKPNLTVFYNFLGTQVGNPAYNVHGNVVRNVVRNAADELRNWLQRQESTHNGNINHAMKHGFTVGAMGADGLSDFITGLRHARSGMNADEITVLADYLTKSEEEIEAYISSKLTAHGYPRPEITRIVSGHSKSGLEAKAATAMLEAAGKPADFCLCFDPICDRALASHQTGFAGSGLDALTICGRAVDSTQLLPSISAIHDKTYNHRQPDNKHSLPGNIHPPTLVKLIAAFANRHSNIKQTPWWKAVESEEHAILNDPGQWIQDNAFGEPLIGKKLISMNGHSHTSSNAFGR